MRYPCVIIKNYEWGKYKQLRMMAIICRKPSWNDISLTAGGLHMTPRRTRVRWCSLLHICKWHMYQQTPLTLSPHKVLFLTSLCDWNVRFGTPDTSSTRTHARSQTHLGTADGVGFHKGGQFIPVIRAGQPALSFSCHGAQSHVCGPQHGEGLVADHREHR